MIQAHGIAIRNGVTTQIGDDHFTFFKTTFSKSRKNFLELLRAGYQDYVINAEALAYMRERYLTGAVIEQLDGHTQKIFTGEAAWSDHLDQLGISQLPHAGSGVHPDPVKIATEGALWGSIQAHGLLQNTVIVSDGAGQFRLDDHADCWIHAERLVHKLDSFNDDQRRAIEIERELIWWLYRDLKLYKEEPSRQRAAQLKARFKRIFSRKTGFASLDRPARPGSSVARMIFCACSTDPKFRSTQTAPKTTSAVTSPSEKFQAEPGPKQGVTPVTPSSACLRHARNLASPSSTISAIASTSKALPSYHRCQI